MQLVIQAPSIWVCTQPQNFRKSIDGLLGVILSELQVKVEDHVFVFFNKSRDKIKCLAWHKNGFVLLLKRLEKGLFFNVTDEREKIAVTPQQLSWLLAGLDWVTLSTWGELEYPDYR